MKNNPLAVEFGRRLKSALVESGCRQSDLAMRLGISASAISQMLNGKMLPTLRRLNEILEFISASPAMAADLSAMLNGIKSGENAVKSEFNLRFFRMRCRRGLSPQQLANRLGMSAERLLALENDPEAQLTLEEADILAEIFDCSPEFLLSGREYTYGRDPSVALEVADRQAGFVPVLRLEDMDGYAPGVSLRDFFALRSREKQLLSINYADCEPVAINADAAELGLPFTGIARILLCDERPDGFAECYLCRDRAGSYQLRDGNSALLGCFSMESKGRFKPLWRLPVLEIVLQPIFN